MTWRIARQASFGTVALNGNVATYHPQPGFAGTDSFYVSARDGDTESNLGRIDIHRGAELGGFGTGYPGTNGVVPSLTANAVPQMGTTIQLQLQNSSGVATQALWIWSIERMTKPTPIGGFGPILGQPPDLIGRERFGSGDERGRE